MRYGTVHITSGVSLKNGFKHKIAFFFLDLTRKNVVWCLSVRKLKGEIPLRIHKFLFEQGREMSDCETKKTVNEKLQQETWAKNRIFSN